LPSRFPTFAAFILGFESSFWRIRRESTHDNLPPALIYVKASGSIPVSKNAEPRPTAEPAKALVATALILISIKIAA
jgi:hypothetical protein